MTIKKIIVLGSTGSIGVNALKIAEENRDRFEILSLSAKGTNLELLAEQIKIFHPKIVSVADDKKRAKLKKLVGKKCEIATGNEGNKLCATVDGAQLLVAGMVGSAGLSPVMSAIEKGITIALANKESLVMAGEMMMCSARKHTAKIVPIDSEHSAVFQALRGEKKKTVEKIILTASGGPFRTFSLKRLKSVTRSQALKHPNWEMGAKITIDSATMMNKGLEVIEAKWLFNVPPEKIDVVVHKESIVHSMVTFHDGSVIAQLGLPDMKVPISFAMNYPDRLPLDHGRLDIAKVGSLTFEKPDHQKFPALNLAFEALQTGLSAPAVLNSANEVAVSAFLKEKIKFHQIAEIVAETLEKSDIVKPENLGHLIKIDALTRKKAESICRKRRRATGR